MMENYPLQIETFTVIHVVTNGNKHFNYPQVIAFTDITVLLMEEKLTTSNQPFTVNMQLLMLIYPLQVVVFTDMTVYVIVVMMENYQLQINPFIVKYM